MRTDSAAGSPAVPGPAAEPRSLEVQRAEFSRRRFLAMPLAGTIAWLVVAAGGVLLPPVGSALLLFFATGSIAFLGMFLSRFTGENMLDKTRPKNEFDGLFFHAMGMSLLVFAIAIPFFRQDYTSLPLTVGILTGLMWLPLSWIIRHWIGVFHAVGRTVLVTATWYLFPDDRFVAVPLVIVGMYLVTIAVLEQRWRRLAAGQDRPVGRA